MPLFNFETINDAIDNTFLPLSCYITQLEFMKTSNTIFYQPIIVLAVSVLVMVGWMTESVFLTKINPEYVSMKFSTAVGFACIASGVLCAQYEKYKKLSKFYFATSFTIGLASILIYFLGVPNFVVDILPFSNSSLDQTPSGTPGLMAQTTGISFILYSTALSASIYGKLLGGRFNHYIVRKISLGLGFIGVIGPLLVLAKYASQIVPPNRALLSAENYHSPMALHTSLLFILIFFIHQNLHIHIKNADTFTGR